jgi:hypothetical protein
MAALAQTATAFPLTHVTGSVVIADGLCCVGGKAGDTLQIKVNFTASSPFAAVTEMRLVGCVTEAEAGNVSWEPFAPEKNYPWTPPINWTSFGIGVQYRDAQGNVSPIYCDDVAVEGDP